MRDFFWGAKYGGLSITLPNKKRSRVPYILPFVNLYTRASLNLEKSKQFSLELLKFNIDFLENKKIKDLPLEQQNFFYFLGYIPEQQVKEFLSKQISFLENINFHQ